MHRDIAASIDDREGFVAGAIAHDAPFGELVGDNQPEAGMRFVVGVVCCSWFGLAQDVDKFVTVERQAGHGADGTPQVLAKSPE